jgi:hypothetical protein
MTDHFVPVPLRFFEALTAGELDPGHFIVGALIAHRCYEVKNTASGVATLRLATLADLCRVSPDTIQRNSKTYKNAAGSTSNGPSKDNGSAGESGSPNSRGKTTPTPHHLRTRPPTRAEVKFRTGHRRTGRGRPAWAKG